MSTDITTEQEITTSALSKRPGDAVVGESVPHESAALHVTGHALYTDDLVGRTKQRAARPPRAGAPRPRPGHPARRRAGLRRRGGRARPDRRRRARHQRRRDQARRAAVPRRGALLRPLRLLGARREPRGRAARGGGDRGRLRGAAGAADRRGGDRRRELPGRAADDGPRRRRGRAGPGDPRLRGRHHDGRAGALLPRDALLAGDGRRGRPGLRAVEHPAPHRDPGDRRPRARRAEPRRDRAVPADGRWLRGQGDAAPRARGGGRARRDLDRTAGPAAAEPRRRT